jgi:anaerobic ribonucleoside-triphosphate reductase activating protein
MSQAAPLARLIDQLTDMRPELTFMCYTGYTLNHLRTHGNAAQHSLLTRLDLLIDGLYVQSRHADLRWRGSDNQQIHFLSPRLEHYRTADDHAAGIEFEILPAGGLRWMGVPSRGFRDALPRALARFGIHISTTESSDERLS